MAHRHCAISALMLPSTYTAEVIISICRLETTFKSLRFLFNILFDNIYDKRQSCIINLIKAISKRLLGTAEPENIVIIRHRFIHEVAPKSEEELCQNDSMALS